MEDLGDSCCVRHLKYNIRIYMYKRTKETKLEYKKVRKKKKRGKKGDRSMAIKYSK